MYAFEKYEFTIDSVSHSFTIQPMKSDQTRGLSKEFRKVYLIKDASNNIIYIGEANSSIKIRFQRAFTSFRYFAKNKKARGGYKGYKFIGIHHAAALSVGVAIFNQAYNDNRQFIEAVEGELVYLVRAKTGEWPKFQNEIHFHNVTGAKEAAEQIFAQFIS
jgi:hypothetical protein